MTANDDEFRYLSGQARALGALLPAVERVEVELPDGRCLSALRFGKNDPEITLLHGAGLNAHTWDLTVLCLDRPALVIDLPGHGDSSWRADADYSPRRLASDVAFALNRWTAHPQLLVGHSLGGLTAAAVAATHPQAAHSLVVVDITPGIDASGGPQALRAFYEGPTDFATRDELVDKAMALGFGGSRDDTERGVFLNTRVRADGRIEWKHHFAHLAAQALAAPDSGQARNAILDGTGWDDLVRVACPITLVRASEGFVDEPAAEEFLRRLPTARVVTLNGGHNLQEMVPVELAALLADL